MLWCHSVLATFQRNWLCGTMQGADGMERATKLKVVVFDKTGTLTVGKPSVLDVELFDGEVCISPRQVASAAYPWLHCTLPGTSDSFVAASLTAEILRA